MYICLLRKRNYCKITNALVSLLLLLWPLLLFPLSTITLHYLFDALHRRLNVPTRARCNFTSLLIGLLDLAGFAVIWSGPVQTCNNNNNEMIQHQMHNIESKIVKLVCRVASIMLLMLLTVLTTITIPSCSLAIAGFCFSL